MALDGPRKDGGERMMLYMRIAASVKTGLAALALGALALSFLVDIVWLFAPHEANTC